MLFDLTIAIEVGLVIACLLFMRRVAETTDIHVITDEIDPAEDTDALLHEEHLAVPDGVEVYEINGPYFFGIANRFEEQMALMGDRPRVRIIRMRRVPFIDSTGLHNLTNLCLMSQKEGITIILSGVNEKVHAVLERSGFYALLGKENICSHINLAAGGEKPRHFRGKALHLFRKSPATSDRKLQGFSRTPAGGKEKAVRRIAAAHGTTNLFSNEKDFPYALSIVNEARRKTSQYVGNDLLTTPGSSISTAPTASAAGAKAMAMRWSS